MGQVSPERQNNDLHITLSSASATPSVVVIKDFYQHNGKVFTLNEKGDYQQHLSAEQNPPQGLVELASQPVSTVEAQPDVASLKVLQRVEIVQSLEKTAASLDDESSHAAAQPQLQLTALEEPTSFVKPAITKMTDDVGTEQPLFNGNVTDDKEPLIEGIGEPGATLEFFLNGELIGYIEVSQAGTWQFSFDIPLEEGGQLFQVRDQATGLMSGNVVLIIDTVAPARAALSSVSVDNSGAAVALGQNDYTSDNTPTFSGRAEANSMVAIYNDKTLIGTTYARPDGSWTFTPPYGLPDGVYAARAVAIDFSGNTGLSSTKFNFIIDTLPPAQPQIVEIIDNEGAIVGPVANGAGTDDTTPTLKGRAEPGTVVSVFDNGVKIAEVKANASGDWTFEPATDMLPGTHTFTAIAKDPAGNVSAESLPWTITIATGVPDAPVVDAVYDDRGETALSLASGETTADNTPVIKGTAEADSVVIIYENGEEIARVNSDDEGNWSFTPDALEDGEYSFTFVAQNPAGTQSEESAPWVVVIDATAPDAPVIGSLADDVGVKKGDLINGETTDDTQPELKGTAEPGSVIAIYDGSTKLGETITDKDGNWAFTPAEPLAEGPHSLTTTATDAVGNTSVPSAPWVVVIDVTAPDQPGIDGEGPGISGVTDNKEPTTGEIANGGTTDDTRPTFNGTGTPGDTVIITDGGEPIGEVIIDENGDWTFTPDEELGDGEHEISVIIQDPAGNQSDPSDPWIVIVDATAPDAPVIGSLADDVGVKKGDLINGETTDDTQPELKGTAEAGSVVSIYDGETKLGEAIVGEDGTWTFTPAEPLGEGSHSLTATATDAVGNTSAPSAPWVVVIDVTAPDQPAIDGEGPGISGVTDNKEPTVGAIENGGATNDSKPTFNGTGTPGDTIIIIDGDTQIGEAPVKEDGSWEFTPTTDLDDGEHEISVIIQDPAGNQSDPSDPWIVIVDTTAPDAPVIDSLADDVGVKKGDLINGETTDDTQPELKGTAEVGSVVSIYDGEIKLGEAIVGEDGTWTFTPAEPLGEGSHSLTTTATDAVGNTSAPSAPWVVVIDVTAPDQPGIDGEGPGISGVTDSEGPFTGPIENGGTTDDKKPTFNGTGTPGDTIIINDGDTVIGEVPVKEDGTWEFTPTEDLDDGEHEISVVIQDPAGNQSAPSDPWIVNVDATAPDAPVISSLVDGVGVKQGDLTNGESTDDLRPTLKGTAEVGSVVSIYDGETKLGEAIADERGEWSFQPEAELDSGPHSFSATAQDKAGNTSGFSEAWNTNIVVELPDAPVITGVEDNVGSLQGALKSGDLTDDRRPEIKGESQPNATVIIYDRGVEIGRTQADADGKWSMTPAADLNDGVYEFTAVVQDDAGNTSPASEAFEVIIFSGEGPTQIARLGHMGKDSGTDGNDFVTDSGDAGRLMYGTLSAELTAGQKLQVSVDGGRTWSEAMVDGQKWAAQDMSEHFASWNVLTRVVDGANSGFVMQQAVTLDTSAPRVPAAVHLDGTSVVVDFAQSGLAAGDRISVVTDGGAHRFEHILTAEEISAGSVSVEVGAASTASAAIIDQAGNQSNYVATSGLTPGVNMQVNGDVTELYGQGRDNVFSVADVSVLDNVKLIEGNGGIDTLKLTGANQVLDLSAWQGRLSSIEAIDITGSGNNTLKISLGDVLDQGHTSAFISADVGEIATVQMAIKGNAGDVVVLSDLLPNGMQAGEWDNLGEVTAAGVAYDVYRNEGLNADLLIQVGVTVDYH
ncbi:Ig-like domain-containing protein [Enterobacteriaceae bacterium C23F]